MTTQPSPSEQIEIDGGIASAFALKARIELLRENIIDVIGPLQAALDAAVAMAAIPSDAGLLHGLRNARACWKSIAGDAADLAAVHAELASVFRQGEDGDTGAGPATGAHDES
jgi:hypothetical protein